MAQKWRERRTLPPLDAERLERMALRYVERYATTRAKLTGYLVRKLRERGWSGEAAPEIEALIERFAELRYVDDESFATSRAASLMRRGYGPRRVAAALKAAGVESGEQEAQAVWDAALAFARRKRIGPFAPAAPDRVGREKTFAAMMRAGHDPSIARRIAQAAPGEVPTWDEG